MGRPPVEDSPLQSRRAEMRLIVNPTPDDRLVYIDRCLDHLDRLSELGRVMGQGIEESLEFATRTLREPLAWDNPMDYMAHHADYLRACLCLERAALACEAGDGEAALAHIRDSGALMNRAARALARQRLGQAVN